MQNSCLNWVIAASFGSSDGGRICSMVTSFKLTLSRLTKCKSIWAEMPIFWAGLHPDWACYYAREPGTQHQDQHPTLKYFHLIFMLNYSDGKKCSPPLAAASADWPVVEPNKMEIKSTKIYLGFSDRGNIILSAFSYSFPTWSLNFRLSLQLASATSFCSRRPINESDQFFFLHFLFYLNFLNEGRPADECEAPSAVSSIRISITVWPTGPGRPINIQTVDSIIYSIISG